MENPGQDVNLSSQFSSSPLKAGGVPDADLDHGSDDDGFLYDEEVLLQAAFKDNVQEEADVEEVEPILIDMRAHFTTDVVFETLLEAEEWLKERALIVDINIKRFKSDFSKDRNAYVKYGCERSGDQVSHAKGRVYKKKTDGKGKSRARKTSSRLCDCPFRVRCKNDKVLGIWHIKVMVPTHNHPLMKYKYGHSILGRLTLEEKDLVRRLARQNIRPKNILKEIKDKNPNNFSLPKTIYNEIAKFKKEELQGRSIIQEVFNLAQESDCFIRHTRSDGKVDNLFWAHKPSVILANTFPYVFMMYCTYKTNQYKMPLLQIIGVTSTNKSFSAAFALLNAEREENFVWAMKMFREFLELSLPSCLVTDKETALMNAIAIVFPESKQLICRWHITKAVEGRTKSLVKDEKEWDRVFDKWTAIENANSVEEFDQHWNECKLSFDPIVVDYMEETWIKKHKTMFVSAWTDKHMHLGNTCTSRVEGVHGVLKNWLGTSNVNLVTHWHSVVAMVEDQVRGIEASFEESTGKFPKEFIGKEWTRYLLGCVSPKALDLLQKEMDKIDMARLDMGSCGCSIRTTHGLPCCHEMVEILKKNKVIPLSSIHIYWRTLSMDGQSKSQTDEVDYRPLLNQFVIKFQSSTLDNQYEMLARLREVIDPKTTLLKEPPIKLNPKGRPKGSKNKSKAVNSEYSTKRDPSYFEHVDMALSLESQRADTGSKKKSQQKGKKRALVSSQQSQIASEPKGNKRGRKEPWYLPSFPPQLHAYVEGIHDVESDGNCGFRAIAIALGLSENDWPKIRQELKDHLDDNRVHYVDLLGEEEKVKRLEYLLDWKSGGCGPDRWIETLACLWLVAELYNVGISFMSSNLNLTYFPCMKGPRSEGNNLIWIGHVNGNHYVLPRMRLGCPMPVISDPWQAFRNKAAEEWEIIYQTRLAKGFQLWFPNGRPFPENVPLE